MVIELVNSKDKICGDVCVSKAHLLPQHQEIIFISSYKPAFRSQLYSPEIKDISLYLLCVKNNGHLQL